MTYRHILPHFRDPVRELCVGTVPLAPPTAPPRRVPSAEGATPTVGDAAAATLVQRGPPDLRPSRPDPAVGGDDAGPRTAPPRGRGEGGLQDGGAAPGGRPHAGVGVGAGRGRGLGDGGDVHFGGVDHTRADAVWREGVVAGWLDSHLLQTIPLSKVNI